MTQLFQEIMKLSIAERIMLVEAIWDSIPVEREGDKLSSETEKLLGNRLESHRANPAAGSTWEEAKARIQQKL